LRILPEIASANSGVVAFRGTNLKNPTAIFNVD
jgi:hypothetical protein